MRCPSVADTGKRVMWLLPLRQARKSLSEKAVLLTAVSSQASLPAVRLAAPSPGRLTGYLPACFVGSQAIIQFSKRLRGIGRGASTPVAMADIFSIKIFTRFAFRQK